MQALGFALDTAPMAATIGLTLVQAIGIPLAVLGAVFMSLGALLQHRGVAKVEAASGSSAGQGLSLAQLRRLLTRPSWVFGTLLLLAAIGLQLASLAFAPLVIVQPLGVISLVLTTIITARLIGSGLPARKRLAVGMCVVGVAAFVTVAAFFAVERPIRTWQIVVVLVILAVLVSVYAVLFGLFRRRSKALFYIVGAGIIYGFVATLAKIVINRIQHGNVEALTVVCVVAVLLGAAAGAYFVQTAYASGPPDMVIAGLTVIDPIVAVVIGVSVLLEVDGAPWYAYALFAVFGSIAIAGVLLLERGQTEAEIEATRERALGRRANAVDDRTRGDEAAGGAAPGRAGGRAPEERGDANR